MKKRFIALFIIFAMLVPFTPAVAADDTVPRPTVEEILSEYHEKAFEAEITEKCGSATAYSRGVGNSGKTLEEETVDTLNAAGYEAYNVTSENYETLEEQLQTDFADMGLDPDGSYIIAISGEENSPSNNARLIPGTLPALPPDGGGPTFFSYTYNGNSYYMRYITVVPTDSDVRKQDFTVAVNYSNNTYNWGVFLDAGIQYAVDHIPGFSEAAAIISCVSDFFDNNDVSVMECRNFNIVGCAAWTQRYIQVYDFDVGTWHSSECSEYAIMRLDSIVYHYDANTEHLTLITAYLGEYTIYSEFYNNNTTCKNLAAQAFLYGTCTLDYTGDIRMRVYHEDRNVQYYLNGKDAALNDINSVVTENGFVFTKDHWSFYG